MLGIRFYAFSPLAGGLLVGTEKLRDTATRAGYRQGLANMMGGSGEAGAAALEAALLKIEGACADAGVGHQRMRPPVRPHGRVRHPARGRAERESHPRSARRRGSHSPAPGRQ